MSPRTSLSNQKIRDERRGQILQVALKVFAYKGLAATKIAEIAAQACISQGLIHHYFTLVLTQSLVNQNTPPEVGKLLGSLGQQVNKQLVRLIEAGQATGKVAQSNPQELVLAFIATIQGLAITQFT
jgi:hypothetical protein